MTNAGSPEPHHGWYSRGYLPHWDHPGMIQSVNFRLGDSMPASVIEKWKTELVLQSEGQRAAEFRRGVEEYLDAGHGGCWLRQPDIASLVEGALFHFDGQRCRPGGELTSCVYFETRRRDASAPKSMLPDQLPKG